MKRLLAIGALLLTSIAHGQAFVDLSPFTRGWQDAQRDMRGGGIFKGYACDTLSCSGHIAGYRWAANRGINDGRHCYVAAQTSNSPSFGEGCLAWVQGR